MASFLEAIALGLGGAVLADLISDPPTLSSLALWFFVGMFLLCGIGSVLCSNIADKEES